MTPEQLAKWAENQIQALIRIGYDASEAERSVNWVLMHLPPGADPRTYVFPAETLSEPLDSAAVEGARIAWYTNDAIPNRYKRLLDAR
jgi:hypothetical protein